MKLFWKGKTDSPEPQDAEGVEGEVPEVSLGESEIEIGVLWE